MIIRQLLRSDSVSTVILKLFHFFNRTNNASSHPREWIQQNEFLFRPLEAEIFERKKEIMHAWNRVIHPGKDHGSLKAMFQADEGIIYLSRYPSWRIRSGFRRCWRTRCHNFIGTRSISFRDLLCSLTICRFEHATPFQNVLYHSLEINSFSITFNGITLKTRAAEYSIQQVGSVLWWTGTAVPVGNVRRSRTSIRRSVPN